METTRRNRNLATFLKHRPAKRRKRKKRRRRRKMKKMLNRNWSKDSNRLSLSLSLAFLIFTSLLSCPLPSEKGLTKAVVEEVKSALRKMMLHVLRATFCEAALAALVQGQLFFLPNTISLRKAHSVSSEEGRGDGMSFWKMRGGRKRDDCLPLDASATDFFRL